MATAAIASITKWFWFGVAAQFVGGLTTAAGLFGGGNPDNNVTLFGAALLAAGWSATLVGIVAKGVELGVRAANDE